MSTESASKPARGAGATKKRGKARYLVLLGFAIALFLAAQTGLLGFGLARLRAAAFPKDESLLEHVHGSAQGVLIVDPHQIELKSLGAEGGAVRQHIERTREDIKKATGVDLGFDVDKLILSPSLVVARGRFDEQKLAARLAELSYVQAEYKGTKYLLRAGEDAIAVRDGSILLYGAEPEIRASIDAEAAGTSLASRDEVTSRLAHVGWDHPILGVALLADSKPSLRAILTGSTGPRAVTFGVSTEGGLSATVAIDAASVDAAEELRKLLEEKRADLEGLKALVGPEAGVALGEIAKRAKLTVEQGAGRLSIQADVRPEELDALAKAGERASGSLGAMYKNVRLLQLLAPGG
ncbi:hypothetical protein SOCEGT47_035480 [Sorangium cellulosum]|jgi:hypothetical protein|uniref:Uncharacterized protein n=1 Tax=Sorangium cellulosum TaxID=56 RepID=A0A4P2Q1F7_SORCE|nr:hypothetical protein [Sorangium cellulosum]AUX23030.1 hypothetical protein SOCEGT47_035480 [Sorangium cellulosum]